MNQTYFNKDWLKHPEYKYWLKEDADRKKAHCKLCYKTFGLSNMGAQALKSHMSGKKHKQRAAPVSTFYKSVSKPNSTVVKDSAGEKVSESAPSTSASTTPLNASSSSQITLGLSVNMTNKLKAEIIWALKSVTSGFSNNSCNESNELFRTMFPDSNIAKQFMLGEDKLRYAVNFGLAPYFKELLTGNFTNSPCHVISFDESMNSVTQKCQIDFIIRFWNEMEEQVQSRYWDSDIIGHSKATDILQHFLDNVGMLDSSKKYQWMVLLQIENVMITWWPIDQNTNFPSWLILAVVRYISYTVHLKQAQKVQIGP